MKDLYKTHHFSLHYIHINMTVEFSSIKSNSINLRIIIKYILMKIQLMMLFELTNYTLPFIRRIFPEHTILPCCSTAISNPLCEYLFLVLDVRHKSSMSSMNCIQYSIYIEKGSVPNHYLSRLINILFCCCFLSSSFFYAVPRDGVCPPREKKNVYA